jgi:hypothetical protein
MGKTIAIVICDNCKEEFEFKNSSYWLNHSKHYFCNRDCYYEWRKDKTNHPHWQGGEVKMLGYVVIKTIGHPYGNELGYVKRSRLVMEEYMGRYLLPDEAVHHINKDREDDSIENLMYFENNSTHMKYHARVRKQLKKQNQLVMAGV